MTDLPIANGSVGGLLAFYSLIHVPTGEVPQVLAKWRRALHPGAPVAITFQLSSEAGQVQEHDRKDVDLNSHRRHPD